MFSCAGNPIVNLESGTPILRYGEAVALEPFACKSRKDALVCIAPKTGHGFAVSVESPKLF